MSESHTLPHDAYAAAVDEALARAAASLPGDAVPDHSTTWSDDAGNYDVYTAAYYWRGDTSTGEPNYNTVYYPHGLVVTWSSEDGWYVGRYQDAQQHGTDTPVHLGLVDLYADPALVAEAVTEVLLGRIRDFPRRMGEWEHARALALVIAEAENAKDVD